MGKYKGRNFDPDYHKRKFNPHFNTNTPPYYNRERRHDNDRNHHSQPISPTTPTTPTHNTYNSSSTVPRASPKSPSPHGYNHYQSNNANPNYNSRSLTPNSLSTPSSSPSSPSNHSNSSMHYSNGYRPEYRSSWEDWDRLDIAESERRRALDRESQQLTSSTQPRSKNNDSATVRTSSSSSAASQGSKSTVNTKQAPSTTAQQQRTEDKEKKAVSTPPKGTDKGNARIVSVPNETEKGDTKASANKNKPSPFVFGGGGTSSFSFANFPPLKGPPATSPSLQDPSKVMHNLPPKPVQPVPTSSISLQQQQQQQPSSSNPSGVSPLNPQSTIVLPSQPPAGQVAAPNKTTEQASYVTYESNMKLLDMHIASLTRSLNNLEKAHVEATSAERTSDSQDLSGALSLIQSEVQCYVVIRAQLHPTQDPQLQRKTILAAHDRILSANLEDVNKILGNLESIPKLPPAQVPQPPTSASDVTHSGSISTAPKPASLPNLNDSTSAPNVTAKRKVPDGEQDRESSVKKSQMPDRAADKAKDQTTASSDKNTAPNNNTLLQDMRVKSEVESNARPIGLNGQTALPLGDSETQLSVITATELPVSPPHTGESNSKILAVHPEQPIIDQPKTKQPVIEQRATNQVNDKPPVTGQSLTTQLTVEQPATEIQVSTEITRQLVDPKTVGSTTPLGSSSKPKSTGNTRLSMSGSQHSPRQNVTRSIETQEMQILASKTSTEAGKSGASASKPSESTLRNADSTLGNNVSSQTATSHRSLSPVLPNPVINPEPITVRPDNAVTLPTYSHGNSYDAIKQELALIREESREQRARTDQLLELLHSEALQRREVEKRLAEMSFEIQDQQMKILRKDLEAKRSEALSMMYRAQAEMREASLIASEAREQRSKAREDSARAHVEIQILQKRIQDMEHQYGSGSSIGIIGSSSSANIGSRYGTLSVVALERFTLIEREIMAAATSSVSDSLMGFSPVLTSANTISKRSANIATATASGAIATVSAGVPPSTAAVAAAMAAAAANAATSTRKQMTPESDSSDKEDPSAVKQVRYQLSFNHATSK
ncbi:hypothetical protein BGX26_006054 [Mortierella sp. AD094]|nr:hypothetical protein BGX26_006054 [Mortierella sp. AD094]